MPAWAVDELLTMLEHVPVPPGRPSCAGMDPAPFDAPTVAAAREALAVCATCPMPVRAWCLELVAPASSRYGGVAGGVFWRKGVAR